MEKRPKRPSEFVSESSCNPRKRERRDGNGTNSDEAASQNPSVESMEVSQSDCTAELSLAENVIEVEVDFKAKVGKKGVYIKNTGISDVLDAELALLNTNGGVIKLNLKTSLSLKERNEKIDDWQLNLNDKRQDRWQRLGKKETPADITDFRPEDMLMFVKKSSIILTEKSNLYVRRGPQKYELQSYSEIQYLFEKSDKLKCCCNNRPPMKPSFIQSQRMPFGEGVSVEYKELTSKNVPDKLRDHLGEYIAQFANTSGGDVYFGISNDGIIKGQHIKDDEMRAAIEHKVKCCMESKIWINKLGEKVTPKRGTHYEVAFYPVDGADEHTFVIQIHICHHAGAVFLNEPECKVINDNNQICNMSFERWLSFILKSVKNNSRTVEGNSNYRDRFQQKKCRTFTYYSVKDTVEKFVADLTSGHPGQLKLQPCHAVEWIKHKTLKVFVDKTEKTFQENQWQSGIAYIERCWEVNLGLPSTKPDNVICDILLCCPQMPLVFVSLTQSDIPDEVSRLYNRNLAAKLKATLVQEADCLEKFYVKHVVVSYQQLLQDDNLSWRYSESPLYPETYKMDSDGYKYNKVLEALVLVLARANVMSSHNVGHHLFNLLTKEQYDILHEDFEKCPKVKITGPPGSGKTVLALERIYRLRKGGCTYDQIYFLCSNEPLKARVESMTMPHDRSPLCIVMTYHEFAPLAFHHHLDNVKHILADEVQNYEEKPDENSTDWWCKLLKWQVDNTEDSTIWLFFHISQRIDTKRSVSLSGFAHRKLKTIIRTTVEIHQFISKHKYMAIAPDLELGHDFMGKGVEVLLPSRNCDVKKKEHLMCILISQLHRLIDNGFDRNRITVLFTNEKERKYFQDSFKSKKNGGKCLIRNGEEVTKEGIVFDTIRRYSGEENDIVIGFCPKFYRWGNQNNDALMVSLCSRAKLRLILIFEDKKKAQDFNLSKFSYIEFDKDFCKLSL